MRKVKTICITLDPELLKRIEQDIKKLGMASRSEYFRYLVRIRLGLNEK